MVASGTHARDASSAAQRGRPHVAGSSNEALERTAIQLVERIVSVLAGTPQDVVNPDVWVRRRR